MLNRLVEEIKFQKRVNKTLRELDKLGERELDDIGLNRADIRDKVKQQLIQQKNRKNLT